MGSSDCVNLNFFFTCFVVVLDALVSIYTTLYDAAKKNWPVALWIINWRYTKWNAFYFWFFFPFFTVKQQVEWQFRLTTRSVGWSVSLAIWLVGWGKYMMCENIKQHHATSDASPCIFFFFWLFSLYRYRLCLIGGFFIDHGPFLLFICQVIGDQIKKVFNGRSMCCNEWQRDRAQQVIQLGQNAQRLW